MKSYMLRFIKSTLEYSLFNDYSGFVVLIYFINFMNNASIIVGLDTLEKGRWLLLTEADFKQANISSLEATHFKVYLFWIHLRLYWIFGRPCRFHACFMKGWWSSTYSIINCGRCSIAYIRQYSQEMLAL